MRPIRALALLPLLAACGGGGSDTPTTPTDTPGPAASVTVTLTAAQVTQGDSVRATAVVRDARGTVLPNAAVAWTSSATNVLKVNTATGTATGLALDTASVIATSGSARGAARVTVRPVTTATITMLPNAFLPFSQVIAVNGTVTYDFPAGIDHNVIFASVAGAPADIQQTRNVKVTRTFTRVGTYPYDCRIHPGMTGEIIVVP